MHTIATEAELRAVIGAEHPGLAEKNQPCLNDFAVDYIARSPFLVLSTADADGRIDASPKGDANPRVGVLFMMPGTPETLRVNGRATLTVEPELLERLAARGKPAVLAIRVEVEEVFFHCAKAFLRSSLWRPDTWGERHPVSFGKMFAAARKAPAQTAAAIDAVVEADYRDNL